MSATGTASDIGLERMLAPLDLADFLAQYWQSKSLLSEIPAPLFDEILAEIGPLDIRRMTALATEGCQAWLSNRYVAHSVFPCDETDVAEFYAAGATLYFLNLSLPRLTCTIAGELGVPRHRVVASLFLTPPDSGAAPHFDKNENFTIQLTGKKRWIVGREPSLRNAPQSHVWGRGPARDLCVLQSQMIEQPCHAVNLEPRALLYVPRGMVHGTEAGVTSWSLNISYTGLMWVDFVCETLRGELLKLPDWRASVLGVVPDCDPRARRENQLSALLEDLRNMLMPERLAEAGFDVPSQAMREEVGS